MANEKAERWSTISKRTLLSAERLRLDGDSRGAVNRSYYAAYQAATSICISHGDEVHFPHNWNNPTHDQLPDLIRNNGNLSAALRRNARQNLIFLRALREEADYKPGHTVNDETALQCLLRATALLERLEII